MSKFHKFLKNDSSSDSEDGELSESNDELETKIAINQQNEPKLDPKDIKTSKSLQIMDKIDTKRNNRFSIWSDLLLEEDLNQSVSTSMDIKKRRSKPSKFDRNCENYSFWTKRQLENKSDKQLDQKSSQSQTGHPKKKKKKKRQPIVKTVDIAIEIAKKLSEPKVDLMRRVCEAIGEQKALELSSATQDIETAGGLMTIDGKRRRTPGGVFFQLLKNDANIPKEKIDFIFSIEQKIFKKKKQNKRMKHKYSKKISLSDKTTSCQPIEGQTIEPEVQNMDQ